MQLTPQEIEYIANSPEGLALAMDYHDEQMTQGQPMGFDCAGNQKRYDELSAERARLRMEIEGITPQDIAEKCESGCAAPVVGHDSEGVPLCQACMDDLNNEPEDAE